MTQPRVPFEACLDVTLRTLGGRAIHVEFESRAGVTTYEFVIRSGDAQYYAGCDANSGMVSRIDVIVAPDDTRWTEIAKIDPTTARNAAIERFPGGRIEEVKHLLMGDGRVAYEFDLEFDNGTELNVYVDAVAGGIFLVTPEYWEIGGGAAPATAAVNRKPSAATASPPSTPRSRATRRRTRASRWSAPAAGPRASRPSASSTSAWRRSTACARCSASGERGRRS